MTCNKDTMKYILPFLMIASFSCKHEHPISSFTLSEMNCNPDPIPEFDYQKVQLIDEVTREKRDTVLNPTKKYRKVFKPCRQMTYRAIFKSADGNVITDNLIKMMATGKRWRFAPYRQDEIAIHYQYTEDDVKANEAHQLNKSLTNRMRREDYEGIIENEEMVWMHLITLKDLFRTFNG